VARRASGAGVRRTLVDSRSDRRLAVATTPGGHATVCTDSEGDCDACPGASASAHHSGAAAVAQHAVGRQKP
jgi:hypothetical protein